VLCILCARGVGSGGASAAALAVDPYTALNLGEAFRHHKTLAAWGEGVAVLEACGITGEVPGVVLSDKPTSGFTDQLIEAMGWHRHWDRQPPG